MSTSRFARVSLAGTLAAALAAGAAALAASTTDQHPTAAKKPAAHPAQHAVAHKLSQWQLHQLALYKSSAPGDEYFGRMKMSYLGINNTFHDVTIEAGPATTAQALIGKASFADEALHAWANRYPHDPELARSFYLAARFYEKVWLPQYQTRAWQYMHIIVERFPTTYFGKLEKKNIALGFTEHYYAPAQACASASASTAGSAGNASATADDPAAPPKPGQPKVAVMPSPCTPADAAPENPAP
ncbi:MAG: hypothetical protein ACREM2_07345 [Vulcanimicrobiaceae bacterium]